MLPDFLAPMGDEIKGSINQINQKHQTRYNSVHNRKYYHCITIRAGPTVNTTFPALQNALIVGSYEMRAWTIHVLQSCRKAGGLRFSR
jgi:hypothetical protein